VVVRWGERRENFPKFVQKIFFSVQKLHKKKAIRGGIFPSLRRHDIHHRGVRAVVSDKFFSRKVGVRAAFPMLTELLLALLLFRLTRHQPLASFRNLFSGFYLVDNKFGSIVNAFLDFSQQRKIFKFYPVYLFYRAEERVQGTDLVVAAVGAGMGTCACNALNFTFRHACRPVLPVEKTLEGYQQKSLLFQCYFARTIEYVEKSRHNSS
jgi:hypothetical protein